MFVINMTGHALSEDCKKQIQNKIGEVKYIDLKISVKRKYPIMTQIIDLLNPVADKINGTRPFYLIMPGLPIAASLILSYVHGIYGSFPKVIELLRNSDGIYVLHDIHDLEFYRHMVRTHHRKNQ